MAKKKRKVKRGKKRAKAYRVSGVLIRIRKKAPKRFGPKLNRALAGKGPVKAIEKAAKKAVKDVVKVLKYPFKAGHNLQHGGMKMHLRSKRKRTSPALGDFTD